ncbi:DUF302 domain-containing protein [bacterium]|nr:DUF302 domain-containing protein [bacterium]
MYKTLFALVAAALCTTLLAGQPVTARAEDAPSVAPAAASTAAAPELSQEEISLIISGLEQAIAATPEMGHTASADSQHSYFISRTLDTGFDDTVTKLKEALAAEKFAVLTEIDLQAKFKEKLQVDIPRYTIFGACGAKWAHAIWEKEFHIGALMPCNVVVAELPDGRTEVFFKDPSQLPMATNNPEIAATAQTVRESVERVLAAL